MVYSRRIISFIVSLILITTVVIGGFTVTVSAASLTGGESGKSVYTYLGKSKDGKGWKNPHYSNVKQLKYAVKINGETKVAYCMEPGQTFSQSHKYTANSAAKAKAWNDLPAARQRVLALIMFYGYNKGKSAPYGNSNDYYAATQALVWEAADGDVTLSKAGKWGKKSNKHDNLVLGRTYAEKNYKWIKEKISAHVKGASFTAAASSSASTYLLKYNYSTKKWSRTLTDSDKGNYLKKHSNTSSSLSVSRSGYSYTFKTETAGTKTAVLVNSVSAGTSQPMLVLTSANKSHQSLIFGATDNTKFYVKLRTEAKGQCKLVKTSDDGKVDGFKFKVTCSTNGYSAVHTTGKDGTITVDLYPGEYTVTEQLTEAQKQAGYIQAKAKKVTVKEKQTATLKIQNKKLPESSNLLIEKETDDGSSAEGFKFEVVNKETGKKQVCITDEDGTAMLKEIELGEYTVTEILNDEQKLRFEEPRSQTVSVKEDGKTVRISFVNKSKTTPVMLKKVSIDGNVSGIKFKISGKLLWGETFKTKTVYTGDDGTIELGAMKPGTYTVEEVMPADSGYLKQDAKTFSVTGEEKSPILIEFENVPTSLYVTKVDAETKEFVEGARFELLDPDGKILMSFSVIKENDDVVLETESSDSKLFVYPAPEQAGFGCIRGLVDGKTYTLRETKAPDGYMMAEDQTFVFEEGMLITIENEKIPIEPETVPPEPEEPPSEPELPPTEPEVPSTEPEAPSVEPEAPTEEPSVQETEPTEPSVPEKIVETGDAENMLLPMGLMLLAAAVACVLMFRKEKEE